MNESSYFLCPACGRPVDPSADHTAVFAEKEDAVPAMRGSRDYAPDAAWFHQGCWPNPFYRWRPRPDAAPGETTWDALKRRTLWFPFSVLALFGVAYVLYIALIILLIGYSEDVDPGKPAIVQFVIAVAGLVPAFGMLASSLFDRGRPFLWFLATVGIYGIWLRYTWIAIGF